MLSYLSTSNTNRERDERNILSRPTILGDTIPLSENLPVTSLVLNKHVTRYEVCGLKKVLGCLKDSRFKVREGGQVQRVVCERCGGCWAVQYQTYEHQFMGTTIFASPCTCPVIDIPDGQAYERGGHIETKSSNIGASLARHYVREQRVGIAQYRRTAPPGYPRDNQVPIDLYPHQKSRPVITYLQRQADRRNGMHVPLRRKTDSKAAKKNCFFFKLTTGRWFKTQVLEYDDFQGGRVSSPLFIPEARTVAVSLTPFGHPQPVPAPVVVESAQPEPAASANAPAVIDLCGGSGITDHQTNEEDRKPATKKDPLQAEVCAICLTAAPDIRVLCRNPQCKGPVLCNPCNIQYICTRLPDTDNNFVLPAEGTPVHCLHGCEGKATHFQTFGSDDGESYPLFRPAFFLGNRPTHDTAKLCAEAWAMDKFAAPVWNQRRASKAIIINAESALSVIRESDPPLTEEQSTTCAMYEKQIARHKEHLAQLKLPNWANDWSAQSKVPSSRDYLECGGGKTFADYMDSFDVGRNPTPSEDPGPYDPVAEYCRQLDLVPSGGYCDITDEGSTEEELLPPIPHEDTGSTIADHDSDYQPEEN